MLASRKIQFLTWLVLLLVVLNLTTIGAIIYHNYQERKMASSIYLPGPGAGNPLNGRFLRQELGFDAVQLEKFRELNQAFRPGAMDISYQIDSLRERMFEQMQLPGVDSNQMELLVKKFGDCHRDLKWKTWQYYRDLQGICREDQREKLAALFRPLFVNETGDIRQGPGKRRGPGWRNSN